MKEEEKYTDTYDENVEESLKFKRLHEYEPIDFLKALVDNYKNDENV